MKIQTIDRSGDFGTVDTNALIRKTGFDGFLPGDTEALYDHAIDCYPAQEWRLVDSHGTVLSEYEGSY